MFKPASAGGRNTNAYKILSLTSIAKMIYYIVSHSLRYGLHSFARYTG